MPDFLITGPDGKKYKVSGDNAEGALAALKKMTGAPQTNMVEQVGTGTSEGIAGTMQTLTNAVTMGLRPATSAENPAWLGGPDLWQRALAPFMSDAEPQTAGQRIGRSIGHDVGAGAVAAPVAGISSLGGMALNTGADVASGAAGGLVDELPGEHPVMRAIASLLAGTAVPAGAALRRGTGAPSLDDLSRQEAALYKTQADSDFRLSPDETQELQGNVSARMHGEGMYPPSDPQATAAVSRLYEMPDRAPGGTPGLRDVEDVRQYINARVMGSASNPEKALARPMKDEIDSYLAEIAARHPEAQEGVEAGFEAHKVSQKRIKAKEVSDALQSAEWRAATTGVGGNDINAVRQNIRRILDDPDKARGYTKAERAQMKAIVEGTPASNAARFVGGLSPQRSPFLTFASGGGAAMLSQPWLLAPQGVGIVAQAIGETLTRKQVADLSAMIRAGKPVSRALNDAEKRVLAAVLATQGQQQLLQEQ